MPKCASAAKHSATVSLPLVDDCKGCGACCRHIGTPPGYASLAAGGRKRAAWPTDRARWARMPAEVRATLETYYAELDAAGWPREMDRTTSDTPCLWFDEASQRCRFHRWRPQICRDFEVGGPDCQRIRKEDGVAAS